MADRTRLRHTLTHSESSCMNRRRVVLHRGRRPERSEGSLYLSLSVLPPRTQSQKIEKSCKILVSKIVCVRNPSLPSIPPPANRKNTTSTVDFPKNPSKNPNPPQAKKRQNFYPTGGSSAVKNELPTASFPLTEGANPPSASSGQEIFSVGSFQTIDRSPSG